MAADTVIRPAKPEDAQALVDIYRYYVLHTAITFEYEVPDVEEFRARMEKTLQRYPYLVAERAGRIVGYAYAGPYRTRAAYDWCAELSVYLHREERGHGIGRALYEALEEGLKRMGILNLYACIACPQIEDETLTFASICFHNRMGYEQCGLFHSCGYKFDRWYDMVLMEKQIGVHQQHQPPVKPYDETLIFPG